MPAKLAFEDFPAGEIVEYGGVEVTAREIVEFARAFDPQPFHVDEAAAGSATGGLIASGWHTCALLLRMNCDAFLARTMVLDEPGVEETRWARPVRPGDRLRVRRRTLEANPGGDGAHAGEVEFLYEVVNQNDEVAMTQRVRLRLSRRREPAD
ncbi:MAG TPA: MaoC/PaaZ C-terminal domain-containing protein [Roseiarcus sp.]|nr:MaoC/PaaZ C-terminal domain-containing protein [Roseiarcus sp.]